MLCPTSTAHMNEFSGNVNILILNRKWVSLLKKKKMGHYRE